MSSKSPTGAGAARRSTHLTLRTQLFWAFALVGSAPVFFLGFVQARAASEVERERADRETVLASSALSRELGRIIDADAAAVRAFATEIREQGAVEPTAVDRAALRYLLSSPSMYTVLVIGTDGIVVGGRVRDGAGTKGYGATSYRDRGYFQRVLGGAPFASELVQSKATGQPALIMAVPIVDPAGKVQAVAAAGIDLLFVKHAVERVTAVAPGLTSVVLDQDRHVVAASGSEQWAPLAKLSPLPLYRPAAGAEPEQRFGNDENGSERRGTVAMIQTQDVRWSVVSTWAEMALIRRALQALGATLGFIVVGLGLALLAGIWMARTLARPMKDLSRLVDAIARGDLRPRPEPPRRMHPRELVELGRSIATMLGYLEGLVTELAGTVATIRSETQRLRGASGDMLEDSQHQRNAVQKSSGAIVQMTDSIDSVGKSVLDLSDTALETTRSISSLDKEIARIADSLEGLAETISGASAQVREVELEAGHVAGSAAVLSRNVDETRQSLDLLKTSIQNVAEGAERGQRLVGEALSAAEAGRAAVDETIGATRAIQTSFSDLERAVQALAGRSEAIGAVVSVIDQVTRATQLLAINASIIAAQSGEQGRGFVVVAERVKAVASETAASTQQITQLVAAVQADIGAAVSAVASGRRTVGAGQERSAEAGVRLQAIIESSNESVDTVRQIVGSAEEQARFVSRVESAFEEVHFVTMQITEAASRQRQAQQRMTEAIAAVRSIGSEVQRSTEAQRGDSHVMAAAVSGMSSRFQAIVSATRAQDNEQNRIKASVGVFDEATKSSVERARQIGQAVSALNERLEQLEEQLRAFRVS